MIYRPLASGPQSQLSEIAFKAMRSLVLAQAQSVLGF